MSGGQSIRTLFLIPGNGSISAGADLHQDGNHEKSLRVAGNVYRKSVFSIHVMSQKTKPREH